MLVETEQRVYQTSKIEVDINFPYFGMDIEEESDWFRKYTLLRVDYVPYTQGQYGYFKVTEISARKSLYDNGWSTNYVESRGWEDVSIILDEYSAFQSEVSKTPHMVDSLYEKIKNNKAAEKEAWLEKANDILSVTRTLSLT